MSSSLSLYVSFVQRLRLTVPFARFKERGAHPLHSQQQATIRRDALVLCCSTLKLQTRVLRQTLAVLFFAFIFHMRIPAVDDATRTFFNTLNAYSQLQLERQSKHDRRCRLINQSVTQPASLNRQTRRYTDKKGTEKKEIKKSRKCSATM